MATLYFNGADGDWNHTSNWWQDNAFSIPATSIPASTDTVYLEANVATGPTSAITLAALYIAQINSGASLEDAGAGISTTGDLIVGKSNYLSGTIYNANLTIGGSAYFYGESTNENNTLTVGSAIFNQYSSNSDGGIVSGTATFNDSSFNNASVTGAATFNDQASNGNSGSVGGNATFNDQSNNNNGHVSGTASVYYPVSRPLGGTVTGTITYYGYPDFYFNAAHDGTWDNHLNWWRNSGFSTPAGIIPTPGATVYIEGNITAGPSVAIDLSALYIAQITNGAKLGSSGSGITATGNLTVGVESSHYGRIESANLTIYGTANFYGSSGGNSSTLFVGQANFYNGSSNYGTGQGSATNGEITGNATFNDTSINYCTIDGYATFNDSSYNASGATVSGYETVFNNSSYNVGALTGSYAVFNDNAYNANGATVSGNTTFNNSSYNASGATVSGNATFNTNSYNNGLVSGNADVYYPVTRPLGGTVAGTITYHGYPTIYTLYFNAHTDSHWNTLSNWWQDNRFSTPAVELPKNGDTVYIEANVTVGPTAAITLAALYIAQVKNGATLGSAGAGISVTGNLTVGSGIFLYGRVDGANLTIGGTANFYGSGGGNSSTLTVGLANFYLGTSNYGTGQGSSTNGIITGNAVFHNNAKNYCSVGGTATFNDVSGNNSGGDITGNATFNDSSTNASGATVGGNGTFRSNASNAGLVSGNASVYYPAPRPLGGTVTGTITYYNYP